MSKKVLYHTLLAIIRFTRQYRHYLLGRRFLLRTDHNSLVWLTRLKNIEGQLARWLEELSQFDVSIVHRAGSAHGNADGMSRIPDELDYCNCYRAGEELSSLPCGGCNYCTRAHNQWSRFETDVDDVVPLTLRIVREISGIANESDLVKRTDQVQAVPAVISNTGKESELVKRTDQVPEVIIDGNSGHGLSGRVMCMLKYSRVELTEFQANDEVLSVIRDWLTKNIEPTSQELFRHSPRRKILLVSKQTA